jgi:hypothetical protein
LELPCPKYHNPADYGKYHKHVWNLSLLTSGLPTSVKLRTANGPLGYYTTSATLNNSTRNKWVPVTTAWRVFRLRMEERPPDMESSCEYTE